jgi:hypothetical protein
MRDKGLNENWRSRKRDYVRHAKYVLTPRHKDLEAGIWTQALNVAQLNNSKNPFAGNQKLFTKCISGSHGNTRVDLASCQCQIQDFDFFDSMVGPKPKRKSTHN